VEDEGLIFHVSTLFDVLHGLRLRLPRSRAPNGALDPLRRPHHVRGHGTQLVRDHGFTSSTSTGSSAASIEELGYRRRAKAEVFFEVIEVFEARRLNA
jgi:hypothetical protein